MKLYMAKLHLRFYIKKSELFNDDINLSVHIVSLNSNRLNLDGTYFETVIPCLEFSIEFQSNKLIYHKEYTKRQQIIY